MFSRSFLWLLLLASCFGRLCSPLLSAAPAAARGLGLQVSLVTSGYEFEQDTEVLNKGFTASVVVTNLSSQTIGSTNQGTSFVFTIFNSSGEPVWSSANTRINASATGKSVLSSRATLRQTTQVPLVIDHTPLAQGSYVLQASSLAVPSLGASAPFVISPAGSVGASGITGRVLRDASPGSQGPIILGKYVGAIAKVEVTEVRQPGVRYGKAPFTWSGTSNEDGTFKVATPPGRFSVRITDDVPELPVSNSLRVQSLADIVSVRRGEFTSISFHLDPLPLHPVSARARSIYMLTSASIEDRQGTALTLKATGIVPTGGWTHPFLVQRNTLGAGVWEFELLAEPPTMIATQVLSGVEATLSLPDVPSGQKIRVTGGGKSIDLVAP